jgi:hypothetical protein
LKPLLFWLTFPLTFLLLIVADIVGGICELYIEGFNRWEAWARSLTVCEPADEHANVADVYNSDGIYW